MTRKQVKDFVKKLFIDTSTVNYSMEKTIQELGCDVLDIVEIVLSCEEEFNMDIDEESINTPKDLIDIIIKQLKEDGHTITED